MSVQHGGRPRQGEVLEGVLGPGRQMRLQPKARPPKSAWLQSLWGTKRYHQAAQAPVETLSLFWPISAVASAISSNFLLWSNDAVWVKAARLQQSKPTLLER